MKRLFLSFLCGMCVLGMEEVVASTKGHSSYSGDSFSHSPSSPYDKFPPNIITDSQGNAHYIIGVAIDTKTLNWILQQLRTLDSKVQMEDTPTKSPISSPGLEEKGTTVPMEEEEIDPDELKDSLENGLARWIDELFLEPTNKANRGAIIEQIGEMMNSKLFTQGEILGLIGVLGQEPTTKDLYERLIAKLTY